MTKQMFSINFYNVRGMFSCYRLRGMSYRSVLDLPMRFMDLNELWYVWRALYIFTLYQSVCIQRWTWFLPLSIADSIRTRNPIDARVRGTRVARFSAECVSQYAEIETDRYVQMHNWTGKWMKKARHTLTRVKLFVRLLMLFPIVLYVSYCIINLVLWWFLVKLARGWRVHVRY